MLTGIGGAESELAGVRTFGVDDAVVVVEDFVDGYGDGEVWVCAEDVVLGFEGAVMAYDTISCGISVNGAGEECSPTTKVSLGSSS